MASLDQMAVLATAITAVLAVAGFFWKFRADVRAQFTEMMNHTTEHLGMMRTELREAVDSVKNATDVQFRSKVRETLPVFNATLNSVMEELKGHSAKDAKETQQLMEMAREMGVICSRWKRLRKR